jgi:hypothetical protein
MDKHYQLQDEIIEKFNEIQSKLAFPTKINFTIVGDVKLKKLVKIKKANDILKYLTQSDIIVYINEEIYYKLESDQKALEILFTEELNSIEVNMKTGVIKMKRLNLITSTDIIKKYGLDEVGRAKDLENLTVEQTEELESERNDNKKTKDEFSFIYSNKVYIKY